MSNQMAIEFTLKTEKEFEEWYLRFVVGTMSFHNMKEFTIDDLQFVVVQSNGEEALDEVGKQGTIMYVEIYDTDVCEEMMEILTEQAQNACVVGMEIEIHHCEYDFDEVKVIGYF